MRPWRSHKRVFKQDQMEVNYTADEFLWSELSLESERINRRRVYLSSVKCSTRKFQVVVVQCRTATKCTVCKCNARTNFLVGY